MTEAADDWLAGYRADGFYCELFGSAALPADHCRPLRERLARLSLDELRRRAGDTARELYNLGITFTVYTDKDVTDRILPFDVIPRVLSAADWRQAESKAGVPDAYAGTESAGSPRVSPHS